jgi:S1-C subfamily serine protease
MPRLLGVLALALIAGPSLTAQESRQLQIRVTIDDGAGRSVPVARHILLISNNPATSPPRRTITAADGTVVLQLRPGSYIVESDRPAIVSGRAYQWIHPFEINAGRDEQVELTSANALVEAAPADAEPAAAIAAAERSSSIDRWKDSVVALWTARTHASGVLVTGDGLVATSQRAIGSATRVDVQVTVAVKVAGRVLESRPDQDIAVLWIDPGAVAGIAPVPLVCDSVEPTATTPQLDLSTIGAPIRGPNQITRDLYATPDAVGGPVFTADGTLVGLTSLDAERGDTRLVPARIVCGAIAAARTKMVGVPPSRVHLPVEPQRTISAVKLDTLSRNSAFSVNPYRLSSADFDIVFITPVLLARAQSRQEWMTDREDRSGVGALTDFGGWSEYVASSPPVLLVRVSPRFVESFWMKVARGAAETQGVSMPPIKQRRPGFARLRALCGGKEVTPVHPFTVERRLSETEGTDEGLYVFDPSAFGPQCGTVTLELFSAKEPARGTTVVVDAAIVRRIAQDFEGLLQEVPPSATQ